MTVRSCEDLDTVRILKVFRGVTDPAFKLTELIKKTT